MNTKRKEYKEYLRLGREIDKLAEFYYKIIGKDTKIRKHYRPYIGRSGAVNYNEIKDIIRYQAKSTLLTHKFLDTNNKEIIELDLLDNRIGKLKYSHTLLKCQISENYYYSLPIELKDYFYKRIDLLNSLFNSVTKYEYYFKYNIPIISKPYKITVERFDIFSDIQSKYDYLYKKQSDLGCYHGIYGRQWCSRAMKKCITRKSRAVMKANLIQAIQRDNFDNLCDDFHNPHNDKWFYD